MRIPRATYRLQFNRDFTFEHAIGILPYLNQLGISDVYASPLFRAGPESTHGYDICCFEEINPVLGGRKGFDRFASKVRELGMGLLVDMVPNHMGGALTNQWWLDVLERGPESKYSSYFDIDWEPPDPSLKGKVLLPILEDHYARVLESGKLVLVHEEGAFRIGYHNRRFPLAPHSAERLTKEPVKAVLHACNGQAGNAASFDRLDQLLREQFYRLAWWRIGSQQINYRRFFDVTELVSLRMERPEVFNATHRVLFELIDRGLVTGLRIDHPDGLWNPRAYFDALQQKSKSDLFVVAEKILTHSEPLPQDWAIEGTTGYEFLNCLNGIFINSPAEPAFTEIYRQFTGNELDFPATVYASKKKIIGLSFQSEITSLTSRLRKIAARSRYGQDLTWSMLKDVLVEVIANFPVYRTYVEQATAQLPELQKSYIKQAFGAARIARPALDPASLGFLESLLLLEFPGDFDADMRCEACEFIMKFQQLTGPVTAKGVEDTSFYNYNRFVSLNEVGGNPDLFGVAVEEFHEHNESKLENWPHSLLATATHDTKRGEDVRARLNVLSEMPQIWEDAVWRWSRFNDDKRPMLPDGPAPHPNDEYLLYQMLVGSWPEDADGANGLKRFAERIKAYMLKAVREAKDRTSWIDPNPEYEPATGTFVDAILDSGKSSAFLADLRKVQQTIAFFGALNSLSQTLLKITSPGVPDFYQGTELLDLNLVDPDNRRTVDFKKREQIVAGNRRNAPPDASDGATKAYVIGRSLEFRNRIPELFASGSYIRLKAEGSQSPHVVAFARSHERNQAIVVVPRLVYNLCHGKHRLPLGPEVWQETVLRLPQGSEHSKYRNIFGGEIASADGTMRLADVLKMFPIALLENA